MAALKPGNVGLHGAGHAMEVRHFEASLDASVAAMASPDFFLGGRILAAIEATREAAGCNTNLGIVLLCAPLAQAALTHPGLKLAEATSAVLRGTTIADAEHAYEAIRLAAPGGLGESAEQDVRVQPGVNLTCAMHLAAHRDRIAYLYSTGYAPLFETLLGRFEALSNRWRDAAWAACGLYLSLLADWPDSHIARKQGQSTAEAVSTTARALWRKLQKSNVPAKLKPALLAMDAALKTQGTNPGTTADLTVATLFAAGLSSESALNQMDLSLRKISQGA